MADVSWIITLFLLKVHVKDLLQCKLADDTWETTGTQQKVPSLLETMGSRYLGGSSVPTPNFVIFNIQFAHLHSGRTDLNGICLKSSYKELNELIYIKYYKTVSEISYVLYKC